MHSLYQHPSIQLFMMSPKPSGCTVDETDCSGEEIKSEESKQTSDDNDLTMGDFEGSRLLNKDISDWEARRCGAMAAKLLRDVKIT